MSAVMVMAGYALGTRRGRARESALKTTIDETNEKLTLVEHELLRRSNLDPVTQLPVQASFQEFLEREWRRAARDRNPVSVIMIEIDHFRAYTERLGKPEGDACLKTLAQAIGRLIHRPADFLARYGQGRFGVVLGGTDSKGAILLAEKLKLIVDALKLPNPASQTGAMVTITQGVGSVLPDRDAPWQDIELIATAERALAQANEAGRNRIGIEIMAAAGQN